MVMRVRKQLDFTVYPSEEKTIFACDPLDQYGGAHCYTVRHCLGYVDGETRYTSSETLLQFIQKCDTGEVVPGLQSEQLVALLLDRQNKLNARFPSAQNEKAVRGLEMFLEAQRERVEERVKRGVMGELKK